jgi:hypothetical protein
MKNNIFTALIIFSLIFSATPNIYSQNLPLTEEEEQDQGFQASEDDPLQIPVSEDMVSMEQMSLQESLMNDLAAAFEALNVEGAETIITVFLLEEFSLEEVVAILKDAGFKVEDVFEALVNTQGDSDLTALIQPLLDASYSSGDVFKLGIRYLRDNNPGISDDQIIDQLLGQDADTQEIKALMKEVFIERIDEVSMSAKADLIKAMINATFSMDEITDALYDNGYSLDQIADIYSNADVEINLAYDQLSRVAGEGNIQGIVDALIESDYEKNDVYSVVYDKLQSTHDLSQIVTYLVGEIGDEGPTDDQINDAIILGSVLNNKSVNVQSIVNAFMQSGYSVNDAVVILNGMGVDTEDTFTYLVNANGTQDVATVALAMIEEGSHDKQTVYELAVDQMQATHTVDQIVSLLIGPIDGEKGPTTNQLKDAELLASVLNASYELVDIAGALLNAGFSIEGSKGAAKILKNLDLTLEDAYDALVNANGGQDVATVGIALHDAGYDLEGVLDIIMPILSSQYQPTQIVTMLIGTIEENRQPTAKQKYMAAALIERLSESVEDLQDISAALIDAGFDLDNVSWSFNQADVSLEDAVTVLLNPGTYGASEVCDALTKGGYNNDQVFDHVIEVLSQTYQIADIFIMFIGEVDPETGATVLQLQTAAEIIDSLVNQGEDLAQLCTHLLGAEFDIGETAKALKRANIELDAAFEALLDAGGSQDIIQVTYALLDSGYQDQSVLDIAVTEMKGDDYGWDISTIVSSIIGATRTDKETESVAKDLVSVLAAQGDAANDICAALHAIDFSFDQIVSTFKKAQISVLDTFNALLSLEVGDDAVAIINSLLEKRLHC